MAKFGHLVLLCCLLSGATNAARILAVYPFPSISHQVVFRSITIELLKHGHEIVVLTADPMFKEGEAPKNLKEIDVHDVSYKVWQEFMAAEKGNHDHLLAQLKIGIEVIIAVLKIQLQQKEVQELIKGKGNFDLLLTEACVRPIMAFSHIYKVPLIQISSFGAVWFNFKVMGAPINPILYPGELTKRAYNLTVFEKLTELYLNYQQENLFESYEDQENALIKKYFGSEVPDLSELQNNVGMLFLNVHPIWEGVRPVPRSVVYLGGLPERPHMELPQELKSYLDASEHGVIYISFGTNVLPSLLSPVVMQSLVRAFSKMPYDVLWKWDKDELPGRSANIRISKWLPQSDLLRHPKIKLFVTQGGLQSTNEAISAGVPLIGIPMLGDQWYNVEKYIHHRIGVKMDWETITERSFTEAIQQVIGDDSYRKNIIYLRTLINDQPMKPIDRAIWWIEHVLRHGTAKHLRSVTANMPTMHLLKLILLLVFLSIIIVIVISYILYKFYNYLVTYMCLIVLISYMYNFYVGHSLLKCF